VPLARASSARSGTWPTQAYSQTRRAPVHHYLSFSQTRSECIQRQKSSALRSSTHTAESRKAGGQKKSRGSEEGSDFSCPTAVGIALARAFQIVAASSRQMGGRVSISQGHDSQPESAVAAALKRRDVRTDDGAHQLRGSRRSARLLALGRGVTLAYPSASRGVYGSDDNSL